ncbi:MAG: chemotaxis protein CheA [Alphaproteobacteria bacterium]|nr:chemotaxis protein CheA [Alphaproteobacteria bacterium]
MSNRDSIRDTFFQECEELLESLQEGLTAIDDDTADSETINSVFRAVHSIKGGAGAFGFDDLVSFAHEFETILDEIRNGRLDQPSSFADVLWKSADLLGDLVAAAAGGVAIETHRTSDLISKLVSLMPETSPNSNWEQEAEFQPLAFAFDDPLFSDTASEETTYKILFQPQDSMFENGNETAVLLRKLATLGEATIICDISQLPTFQILEPEKCYLSWMIELCSSASIEEIQDVFEFVEQDCDLKISSTQDALNDTSNAPEDPPPESNPPLQLINDNITQQHDVDGDELEQIPPTRAPAPARDASRANRSSDSKTAGAPATVRVDVERIDKLINLIGELVVNQAMLSQCHLDSELSADSDFVTGLDELKTLTRDVQDSVMAIRAQPVKSLFQRMARIVREASAATGKDVHLEISGELTEVDKTVLERLADPLTHMVRNAVDHGLETPEQRQISGKPTKGIIHLAAAHRSGRVVIDVSDDGAGINRARVLETAIRKNLISQNDNLSPEETDALLFLPGFSTVTEISNLSGRGVGMDVVRSAIRALGGRISINSEPGLGSTFSISLPLTLAVLDGMVVEVAQQKLVIPIAAIIETLLPNTNNFHSIGHQDVIFIRDTVIPVVDLGNILGFRPPLENLTKCVLILLESDLGVQFAVLVDAIHDQRQLVIKALEENYGEVAGAAAATILGDGRIALILDPNDRLFIGHRNAVTTDSRQIANG